MTPLEIGIVAIAGMFLLIFIGVPIAITLFVTGFLGIAAIRSNVEMAGLLSAASVYNDLSKYVFGTIPLYVLMGVLISESSIGRETFHVMNRLLASLRGGLGVATVGSNAVFAAVTGVSIASVAVFSKVAVPEMLRYKYDSRFAVGVVAGSSVLGMMIPPSLLLIVYALIAQQSIGAMFIAGVIPGILIVIVYSVAIVLFGYLRPEAVGRSADGTPVTLTGAAGEDETELRARSGWLLIAPVAVLIAVVLGGIYSGVFSPTEAGAAGAFAALVIVAAKGQLTFARIRKVLRETATVTASVAIILAAAAIYGKMLTFSGIPVQLTNALVGANVGFGVILVGYLALLLFLGLLLDSASILLITVPLFLPVMLSMGVDPIWFGIVTVLAVEIGLLTPPVGIACFVLKSSLENDKVTINEIFMGAAPFAVLMMIVLAIIVLVPSTATILVK